MVLCFDSHCDVKCAKIKDENAVTLSILCLAIHQICQQLNCNNTKQLACNGNDQHTHYTHFEASYLY